MVTREEIDNASARVAEHVLATPLRISEALSGWTGGEVWLKLENLQHGGSFKVRGVANKVLALTGRSRRRRLFAASTGNHGAAVAMIAQRLGLDATLFMPTTASGVKVDRLRAAPIDLELVGHDCVEAEMRAADAARAHGGVWISPYNDQRVIEGQGTVAVELCRQLERIDDVLVPVGGGGLVSGVAAYLKAVVPGVRVVGCQPRASCVMQRSIEAGEIVADSGQPTVSDATAGGIESGSVTFDLCRRLVDEFVLLEESEILAAIGWMDHREGQRVEGAAALPAAAVLRQPDRYAGRRAVLLVSGGVVGDDVLRRAGIGLPQAAVREV